MPACKLTPDVEVEILNLVAAGNTLIHSARAAGVISQTAKNWVAWGRDGREPYAAFVAKLDTAEAKATTEAMAAIKSAARSDWRAAKFYLEHAEKRGGAAPESITKQVEEILQTVEDVLGKSAARKVLNAIIERSGGAEASDADSPVRLVTG